MSDDLTSNSDDLNLNSVDRFRKQSKNLVLESHSHCEVPAGCGGAVLRWVDPNQGIPLSFVGGFLADAKIFVDGEEVVGTRINLQPGEHLLCIELTNFAEVEEASLFSWYCQRDVPSQDFDESTMVLGSCLSSDDQTWVAKPWAEPDETTHWLHVEFEDEQPDLWQPLIASSFVMSEEYERNQWFINRAAAHGAIVLDLPKGKCVRIRKLFTLGENDV